MRRSSRILWPCPPMHLSSSLKERTSVAVQDGAYWGAWALTHWASLAVSGLLCAIIARYPFPHTDFGLMLLLLWLTAAALLAFAYFLSALFAKARVAGMASAMLYAVAMVPGCAFLSLMPVCVMHSLSYLSYTGDL